jgi:hypothetical protein
MLRRVSIVPIAAWIFVGHLAEPSALRADQVRDWMFDVQAPGTYLNTDIVLPGVQAQLEQRIPVYGKLNELNLKVNALPTLFYYESQADVDLRILVFTFGASAGFRDTFGNLSFEPGEPFDHDARRLAEKKGRYSNAFTGFAEGRFTLSLPFNDWLAIQSINGFRYEGGTDRTFDWRMGIVRDSGVYLKSNTTFYLHHRKFGANGPQLEVLSYELDGKRNTQFNYGFTFVGRVGFRKRFDLLYLTVLLGLSGQINGVDTSKVYGDHYLHAPLTIILAYRVVWDLTGPRKSTDD